MSRGLVVDDNLDLAEDVAELVGSLGVACEVAGDAESAIQIARARHVDLAIVDLRLPGGASGVELVPRLREASPNVEIIIVTGDASVDSAAAAVRHGISAYLAKPFDVHDLLAVARRALDQARLRAERQRLADELARSEAFHRALVETIDAAILLVDDAGRVVFANRSASALVGQAAEQLGGIAFLDTFVAEEDHRRTLKALREVAEGHPVREFEASLGVGPARRVVRWSVRRIEDAGPARAVVVGVELTVMLALQRRATEAEALAAVGQLTTGLAHEVRNPLNAASLQLELLSRTARKVSDAALGARLAEGAAIVKTELARLERMLNDFLSLARPRAFDLVNHDLAAVVDDVLTLEAPVAEARSVTLRTTIARGAFAVRIDESRIKQVLLNSINNALDALKVRVGGEVVVEAVRVGDLVEVRVSDNGPGLPDVALDLFQPFVTTKEAGTGLGLSIVRTIVERHGGTVSLVPREGGGAALRFTVQAAR